MRRRSLQICVEGENVDSPRVLAARDVVLCGFAYEAVI